MSIWERFEGIANVNEVNDAKSQMKPVEAGQYQCVLEEIKPAESSQGLPMIKGKFKMIEGGRTLFYNQMIQNLNNPNMTAVNIAEAVTFVSNLMNEEIEFQGIGHLATVIESIPVGQEYTVEVSYGKKDLEQKFPKLKIVAIASNEYGDYGTGVDETFPIEDGDIPY